MTADLTVRVRCPNWEPFGEPGAILVPPSNGPVARDPRVEPFRDYLRGHHPPGAATAETATFRPSEFLYNLIRKAQADYREDSEGPTEKGDLPVASAAVEYAAERVLPRCPTFDPDRLQAARKRARDAQAWGDRHPDDGLTWTAPYEDKLLDKTVKVRLRPARTWAKVAPLKAALGGNQSAVLRHVAAIAFAHYDAETMYAYPDHREGRKAMDYAQRLLERVARVDG